ncbi:MAG: hypothetical protein AVDCRST_MAG60-2370, partial [uncultured Nocardioides sp.]
DHRPAAPRGADHPSSREDRRHRRVPADRRPGEARHRDRADRGGRHRRRLGQAQPRPRRALRRRLRGRPAGGVRGAHGLRPGRRRRPSRPAGARHRHLDRRVAPRARASGRLHRRGDAGPAGLRRRPPAGRAGLPGPLDQLGPPAPGGHRGPAAPAPGGV